MVGRSIGLALLSLLLLVGLQLAAAATSVPTSTAVQRGDHGDLRRGYPSPRPLTTRSSTRIWAPITSTNTWATSRAGIFNDIVLGGGQMPHNLMVNSGALVVTSLIKTGFPLADRYDFVFNEYKKFAADEFIAFNNSVFLSERESASRNFTLAFYPKEHNCFPPA
ncbi:Glutaminase [Aphelenchoides fujianensis]|nr:Glutaminase [Aphelenchoides fujianensis]